MTIVALDGINGSPTRQTMLRPTHIFAVKAIQLRGFMPCKQVDSMTMPSAGEPS